MGAILRAVYPQPSIKERFQIDADHQRRSRWFSATYKLTKPTSAKSKSLVHPGTTQGERPAHFVMNLFQAGVALASLLAFWYITTAVRSWYRLRHIPGPFLAKFSYLFLSYIQQSGRQYYIFRDEYPKYGPLVRVGPNELSTSDPNVLRKMTSARAQYTRDNWYTGGRWNPYAHNMFTTTDTKAHDDIKSKMAIGYGDKNSALEPGVDEQVKMFVRLIKDKYLDGARLLDFGTLTSYFTMDVITKAGFGEAFGYLEKEEDLFDFLAGVRDNWQFMGITLDVPWIREIFYSPFLLKLIGPKMTDEKGLGRLMK